MLWRMDGDPFISITGVGHLTVFNLQSVRFFYTLKDVQADLPTVVVFAYGLGNVALQGLNWFWYVSLDQVLLSIEVF